MDVITLLISAAAAIFFAIRLYQVLGRKTGHTEDARPTAKPDRKPGAAPSMAASAMSDAAVAEPIEADQFVEGARKAYHLIVDGFAKGDKAALEALLTPKVYARYAKAIDDRAGRGETTTTEIDRIRSAIVTETGQSDDTAIFKVQFKADIATETRSRDDERISGDMTRVTEVEEVWTFERALDASDPNWRLAGVKAV